MKHILTRLFLFNIISLGFCMHTQAQVSGTVTAEKEKITLERADALEGVIDKVAMFKGNVVFRQGDLFLYCDSAHHYEQENTLEAFGHVRMRQGDSITMTSKRMLYNGNTKSAEATGDVVLVDKQMTLKTDALYYDLNTKSAYYTSGGKINDQETQLTSKIGIYNTQSKTFFFKEKVKVVNHVKNYTLISDTLEYNTITNQATFRGPTTIDSPDGQLKADEGEYNTQTGVMTFRGRSRVLSGKKILEGKSIFYDEISEIGVVTGDVCILSKEDSIIITGDEARYWGKTGKSMVYGHPVMKNYSDGDTLFMTADTLISYEYKDKSKNLLLGYHHVRLFKSDLQARCDSFIYRSQDSTMHFIGDPVLWSSDNQIEADSLYLQMANGDLHSMFLKQNSFMISQDTLKNYNQIKGRDMSVYFKNGDVSVVYVDGNGESVYYAVDDEKNKLTGLNKTLCSNMVIRFADNKVQRISFLQKPEASFIPPKDIQEEDELLKGFQWREAERPDKASVVSVKEVK